MAPYISDRELHEECGVFGIFGVPGAASLTYYGLHALQHRGQEGCGIVSVDDRGALHRVKGSGLVTEVFNARISLSEVDWKRLPRLSRYSRSGSELTMLPLWARAKSPELWRKRKGWMFSIPPPPAVV